MIAHDLNGFRPSRVAEDYNVRVRGPRARYQHSIPPVEICGLGYLLRSWVFRLTLEV
jgi:hypothetical protein